MKMTVKEAMNHYMELSEIIKKDRKYPQKMRYAIARNYERLGREVEFAEKQREEICTKYANKDEEGNPVISEGSYGIPKDKMALVNDEMKDMYEVEIDVDIMTIGEQAMAMCENDSRFDIPTISEEMALLFMAAQ